MQPGNYNFGTYVAADTVKERTFTITRTPSGGSAAPEDLSGADVAFTFRDEWGVLVATFAVGSGVTVADNVVTLAAFAAPGRAGTYSHDMEITFADGERSTYLYGSLIVSSVGQTRNA